jgi:hypothetical protein
LKDNKSNPHYKSCKDIFDTHGFIVFLLYLLFRLTDFTTPTGLWLLLGKIKCLSKCCFDDKNNKTKPWWQDIAVLLHALATILVATKYSSHIVSWVLIADMVAYHVRVLWFDDLTPCKSRKVWSHRRILFQGLINYVESIFLFGVIYAKYCGSSFCKTQIYQASFKVATTFTTPDELLYCPAWVGITQVCVSIFFLVVVVSVIASIGYKRKE